jgi:hypothetical protein
MFNPDAIPTPTPPAIPSLRREDMLLVELHQHAMLVYALETLEVM